MCSSAADLWLWEPLKWRRRRWFLSLCQIPFWFFLTKSNFKTILCKTNSPKETRYLSEILIIAIHAWGSYVIRVFTCKKSKLANKDIPANEGWRIDPCIITWFSLVVLWVSGFVFRWRADLAASNDSAVLYDCLMAVCWQHRRPYKSVIQGGLSQRATRPRLVTWVVGLIWGGQRVRGLLLDRAIAGGSLQLNKPDALLN